MKLEELNLDFAPQVGTKNHCHMAQVWKDDDKSLCHIDSTDDEKDATRIAKLFASSPKLLMIVKGYLISMEAMREKDILSLTGEIVYDEIRQLINHIEE